MADPGACLNCDQPLGSPLPRYCPSCGQETRLRPPTLREFAQQFGGAYISTEGALWRSLGLLLLKPGAITREYLAGRRRRYVLPLRLYLTISVIVLMALGWTGTVQFRVDRDAADGAVEPMDVSMFNDRAGIRQGQFYCRKLPDWLCTRLRQRIDVDPASLSREIAAFGQRFFSHLGAAMFVLVPAFAAGLKLAYLGRRMRYTEHLVFALHLHAFWFLMLGLLLTRVDALAVAAFVVTPVHSVLALRRVYGGRWWALALRAAALAAGYLALLGAAVAALGIWALLF
ncbi:MAG: DUF3667 domain-containing protein [Burkholderiaceae bacterium]